MSIPKVFISYSHDSSEHDNRVLALSNRLRREGVNVIIDQYEASPPEGWPRWMDRNIRDSDFVIVICTETYYNRVIGKSEPGKGRGVKWESTLTFQYIYDVDTENTRFIPVLFEPDQVKYIPTPLRGATHYCIDTDQGYESLYRRLTNQPLVEIPDLGKLLELPLCERKQDFLTAAINRPEEESAMLNNEIAESSGTFLLIRPVMNKYNSYPREFYEILSFSIGLYIKSKAIDADFEIVDLPADSATKQAFESAIQLYRVKVITFLGHGDPVGSALIGQMNTPVVDVSNVHLGKGKGYYCLCCHAAEYLGKSAISSGAIFFIGFVNGFRLVPYGVLEYIVSHCAVSGLIELLKQVDPIQALARMEVEHSYWIDRLESEQDELGPDWFLASAVLRSNMANLKLLLP